MMALKMSSQFFASDEIIVDRSKSKEPTLFIISEGEVELFLYPNLQVVAGDNTRQLFTKKKGEVLCEFEFLQQLQKPNQNIKSIGVTELHSLKLSDFLEVLQKFPEEHEAYSYIKDKMSLNREYTSIGYECNMCSEKDHVESECPYAFYDQHKKQMNRKLGVSKEVLEKFGSKNPAVCYKFERGKIRVRSHTLKTRLEIEKTISQFSQNPPAAASSTTAIASATAASSKPTFSKQTNRKRNKQVQEIKILSLIDSYNNNAMNCVENEFILNLVSPQDNLQNKSKDESQDFIFVDKDIAPSSVDATQNLLSGVLQTIGNQTLRKEPILKSQNTNQSNEDKANVSSPPFPEQENGVAPSQFFLSPNQLLMKERPKFQEDPLVSNEYEQKQEKSNKLSQKNSSNNMNSILSTDLNITKTPPPLQVLANSQINIPSQPEIQANPFVPDLPIKTPAFMPTLPENKFQQDGGVQVGINQNKRKTLIIQSQDLSCTHKKEYSIYFPHNNFSSVLSNRSINWFIQMKSSKQHLYDSVRQ